MFLFFLFKRFVKNLLIDINLNKWKIGVAYILKLDHVFLLILSFCFFFLHFFNYFKQTNKLFFLLRLIFIFIFLNQILILFFNCIFNSKANWLRIFFCFPIFFLYFFLFRFWMKSFSFCTYLHVSIFVVVLVISLCDWFFNSIFSWNLFSW